MDITDRPYSTPPFQTPFNNSNLPRKNSPTPPQSYLHQESGPIQREDLKSAPESPPLQTPSFMRLIAPLKNTLSLSADNIPKPLSVTKNLMAKNLGNPRPSTVSKCQSID